MDLKILLEQVPDGDGTWLMSLASGLKYTLIVAALAWIIAFALGSILGVMRTTENRWAVRLGNAYVEIFRNVPLLVQFFVWFFVLPSLLVSTKRFVNALDPLTYQLWASVLCLGTFTAARIAEQVRAGIQSLPRGQRHAAYAMGLTQAQAYRYILLPVAYRIIIPPMTSEVMNLIKNTSLGYSIGLTELFFRTREMGETTFRYYEAFTAATIAYVAISLLANRAMALIERRAAIPGFIGGRAAPAATEGAAMNNLDFGFFAHASTLAYLWKGLQYNLQLTVATALGGIVWGTLLAMARLSTNKALALAAAAYVNLMRSIPLLLVIFWFYFLSPVLIQWVTHADRPPQIGADRSAYVTFILFEGAYFCEIMRAGIQSIPRGQVGAAYAVGLNYWQAMRYIILPQAFRNMLPVLLTQTIILFQDTSLVSLLNVTDFIGAIGKLGQSTGHLIEGYAFAAPVYFLICYLLSLAVKGLQKKIAIVR